MARAAGLERSSPEADAVFVAVYRSFVESLDAIDNGIDQFESERPPRYAINSHLPARVGTLNPAWNDPDQSQAGLLARFLQAVELTGREFLDSVQHHALVWLPGRAHVLESVREAATREESGEPEAGPAVAEKAAADPETTGAAAEVSVVGFVWLVIPHRDER